MLLKQRNQINVSIILICIAELVCFPFSGQFWHNNRILFDSEFKELIKMSCVQFVVSFAAASLSQILSHCQQEYFSNSLYVIAIVTNFLLVNFSYCLSDVGLFGFIALVVRPQESL